MFLSRVFMLNGLSAYDYDDTDQLTNADHSSQADESYTYDDNGNRIGGDYDTDANNLTIEDANYTYAYDAEGNRILRTDKTTGEKLEYEWDHRNRLTLVTYKTSLNATTKKVAYEYDAFDRRIRKRVDDNGNGTWDRGEQYVYDGDHITLVFDDNGNLIRRNLFGPNVDQVLASEFIGSPNETNWYFADHLGTVRDVYSYDALLDDVISEGHIEYDSFGNLVGGAVDVKKAHFAYTGREWDADAQLYYYRKRWYDSVLAQFVSQDPIGFDGGDTNLARYVANNSLKYTDPTGHEQFVLPGDPTGLPPEWKVDPTHRYPHGTRYRHPNGDILDWHPGQPGKPGWGGKDHWHHNKGDDHLKPGTLIDIAIIGLGASCMVLGGQMMIWGGAGSAVLVADDITGVGVVDDPGLVITGGAFVIGGAVFVVGGVISLTGY